ncbi:MAG: 2-C-methyl-D-erythritol 4-phosphate cytidylyltransferase [Pseudomonadota bacterium]
MATASAPALWAVVPAAGGGARMRAARPKQYLPLLGRAMLLHTLERLGRYPRLRGLVVGIAADDAYWPTLATEIPNLLNTYIGGAERAQTVLNGLRVLETYATPDDWVLVHDAARPCVRHTDIDALLAAVAGHADGGLLALPLSDTVKRADHNGCVEDTVARAGLWRALTPQVFRLAALSEALESAMRAGVEITDEASAMEYSGARPRLVHGHADNIKITVPEDLALAELFLREQERESR